MKRNLCLLALLVLSFAVMSCSKLQARVLIKKANEAYYAEDYGKALESYEAARSQDPSFPDLDRLIGYSSIGLFKPNDDSPENQKHADRAIRELERYLKKRPEDEAAREALINLFLNADRTSQAIDYFREYLKQSPADLNAVKSIATLYAKQGNFPESINWYKKITLLDSKSPEAFYTYGVVLYEKVAKDPPAEMEQRLQYIEEGKDALQKAISLNDEYFEALVYMNLLFREQAKLAETPEEQQELLASANQYRDRAIAISRARKAEAEKAATDAEEGS